MFLTTKSSSPQDVSFNTDELELICSFMMMVRGGALMGAHQEAAFSLLDKMELMLGEDFVLQSTDHVDMQVVLMDSHGSPMVTVPLTDVEFDIKS